MPKLKAGDSRIVEARPPIPPPERNTVPNLDALLPVEIAMQAERLGAQKAKLDAVTLLALAVLAGALIAQQILELIPRLGLA